MAEMAPRIWRPPNRREGNPEKRVVLKARLTEGLGQRKVNPRWRRNTRAKMTRFSKMRRFYLLNSVVPFEEDATHEFKGHRNITAEEVPPWCYIPGTDRRSRKAVSRNINGFLNTGKGGTIYLGITDEGSVKGLHMTHYQKDHVTVALKDALHRYTPPVPEEYYKVEIVECVDAEEADKNIALELQDNDALTRNEMHPEERDYLRKTRGVLQETRPYMYSCSRCDDKDANRHRPHLLRTSDYCWCDREAIDAFNEGLPAPLYVVEITVFPWKQKLTNNKQHCLNLHPVYEDEEGKCYFRRQASLVQYSIQEVVELTKQEIHNHFKPLLLSIKEEMQIIKEQYFMNNRTEGS